MIDYGEEKQTYGAPKIDVGPVAQVLTALYLGTAVAAFSRRGRFVNSLPRSTPDCPAGSGRS